MKLLKVLLMVFKKHNLVFTSMFLLLLWNCASVPNEEPIIKKGEIDLSIWNFKQNPKINLDGELLFYWKQWPVDENDNFNLELLEKKDTLSRIPALWTDKGYNGKGYGTYRFFIKRKETKTNLFFNIPRAFAACEIWINGQKRMAHGKISKNEVEEEIDGRPLTIALPNEYYLDIMILASNHKHRLGGGLALRNTIVEAAYFENKLNTKRLLESVMTFLILCFGIYQVFSFITFPKHRYFLYLGLFCLLGASRQLFVGEAFIYEFFPEISFNVVQKMRYLGYYGSLGAVFMYHNALFPGYFSKRLIQYLLGVIILGIVYVICTPVFYGTYSAPVFQVLGMFIIVLSLYQVIRAIKDKRPYAKGMLVNMSITGVLLLNDLLNALLIIQTEYLINFGLFLYVCFQVILNNKMKMETEKKLVALLSNIEEMSNQIHTKEEEISKLLTETYQHLKSKENLVENLKKVALKETNISIQNIIADLRSELLDDSKLKLIKNDIETLNYKFSKKIKELHPNLTKTDIEICCYLHMSLGRKEIARLRNTSIEAVRKSRYRLRKKMNLAAEEDLDDYIQSI